MAANIFKIVRKKVTGLFKKGRKEEAVVEPLVSEPLPDAESRFTEEYKEFLGEGEETGERQAPEKPAETAPEGPAPVETAEEADAEAVPAQESDAGETPAEEPAGEEPAGEEPAAPAPEAGRKEAKTVRRPGRGRRRPGRSGWSRRGGRALRRSRK